VSTRRAPLVVATLLVAVAMQGCGSDKPQTDRERVRDVVQRFDEAFSGGDYGTACELLHSRRRQQLEYGRGQSCEDILAGAAKTDARLVDALADARITSVTFQGDFAIVGVEGPSIGARQAMVDKDGDRGWRLSESPAGL
jgi:hypothetical protein